MHASLPLEQAVEHALRKTVGESADLWWFREQRSDEPASVRELALPSSDRAALGAALGVVWAGGRVVLDVASVGRVPALVEGLREACASAPAFPGALVLRVPFGGELGPLDGPWLDLLLSIPGLRVLCPRDGEEATRLLDVALGQRVPVVLLESRGAPNGRLIAAQGAVVGDGAQVLQTGRDLVLVGWGAQVGAARSWCQALEEAGLDVGLVDLVRLAPLDEPTLAQAVRACGRVVVLLPEEDAAVGAEAVASRLRALLAHAAFWSLEAPIATVRVGTTPCSPAALHSLLTDLALLETP